MAPGIGSAERRVTAGACRIVRFMNRPAGAELEAARKRVRNVLVAGVALGSTGHIAAVTVATIVASQMLGSQALAGLPGATVVLGAAMGSVLLSGLMARSGRRRAGLTAGYGLGVVGALIATAAVLSGSFPLLLAGTLLIGFGNSSNQLSRYAAGDMVPTDRGRPRSASWSGARPSAR